jgi:hypothetical protein
MFGEQLRPPWPRENRGYAVARLSNNERDSSPTGGCASCASSAMISTFGGNLPGQLGTLQISRVKCRICMMWSARRFSVTSTVGCKHSLGASRNSAFPALQCYSCRYGSVPRYYGCVATVNVSESADRCTGNVYSAPV